jgi:hypothetical protein
MYMALQRAARIKLEPLETQSWFIQESDSLFRPTTLAELGLDYTQLQITSLKPYVECDDDEALMQTVDIETGAITRRDHMTDNKERPSADESLREGDTELMNKKEGESHDLHAVHVDNKSLTCKDKDCHGDDDDSRLSLSSSSTMSLVGFIIDKQVSLATGAPTCGVGQAQSQAQAQAQEQSKHDGHMCIICCDEPANACFMECGHGNVCYECAMVVAKKIPAQCPICRIAIVKVFKMTKFVDKSLLESLSTTQNALLCDEESTILCNTLRNDPDSVTNEPDLNANATVTTFRNSNVSPDCAIILQENERLVLSEEGVRVVTCPYHDVPLPSYHNI